VSTTVGGAFAGSLAGGSLASARGRRGTLAITSGVLAAGTAVCAIAPSTNALLVGRAICGLGIGLSGAVAPLYVFSHSNAPILRHLRFFTFAYPQHRLIPNLNARHLGRVEYPMFTPFLYRFQIHI
jgi:MFS family permease